MTEQRGKALGRMERLTGLLRKGARTAASIERIAAVGRRLRLPVQLSARALFAKHDRGLFAGAQSQGRVGGVGSESQVDGGREHASIARLIQRFAATAKAMRATARATDSISNKATSKLPVAMAALARTERSVESGNVARAIVTAPRGSIVAPVREFAVVASNGGRFGNRTSNVDWNPGNRRRSRGFIDSRSGSAAEPFTTHVRGTVERQSWPR